MSLYIYIYMDGRKRRGAHMSYNILYVLYCVPRAYIIWQKSTHNIMNIVQGGSPSTINPIFPLIMDLFKL